jgi:type VI secretion system secreted protein VgrG
MKKRLIIISIFVLLCAVFVSCSAKNSGEIMSTTALTDSEGVTHYYAIVTDEASTAYVEIETALNGEAVTNKDGSFVTNSNTTVISSTNESTATATQNDADNTVEFENTTDETAQNTTTTTTQDSTTTQNSTTTQDSTTMQKDLEPATDSSGWITKWY